MLTSIYPAITSVVSGIFAIHVFWQYLERRKFHQLIWSVAFALYFIGALFEFLAYFLTWEYPSNYFMYRLYYVVAPPMVALLGVGTLLLLFHKRWGQYFLIYTVVLSVPLFALGLSTPDLNQNALTEMIPAGRAMPSYVRNFSPLMTIPGSIALVGGALYSYFKDRTRTYCIPIAVGGVAPAIGGSAARLGEAAIFSVAFYVLETVGAILLYWGFVWSARYIKARERRIKRRASLGKQS